MQKFDYIILGGGISGLTFGRLLQKYTKKSFIILEKENEVGGLCRTHIKGGNYLDIGGGHFFHSKYQEVYDFVFSHIPESAFNTFDRVSKIYLDNKFVDYPLEQHIWQLDKEDQVRYIESLIDAAKDTTQPATFKEWVYKNLGKEISERYMIPYNRKIWGVGLDELGIDWLNKMPRVDLKEILRSVIFKVPSDVIPSHKYFYYPKEGGFQRITDAIYEPLKGEVSLNEVVKSMELRYGFWHVNDRYKAKNVINTVPWRELNFQKEAYIQNLINCLRHSGIAVSFKNESEHFSNAEFFHWCFLPGQHTLAHRVYQTRAYCKSNDYNCYAYETNLDAWRNAERDKDLLYFYENEYAYPVPAKGRSNQISEILRCLEGRNLYGLGRWGQWQHFNSDVCIYEAMSLFDQLEKIKIS